MLRLVTYVTSAKARMAENFSTHPCLGLHCGFGQKETDKLVAAVARHGRQDQFDALAVPLEVLLRTLSFIPSERDPRLRSRITNGDKMVQKTMLRAAAKRL